MLPQDLPRELRDETVILVPIVKRRREDEVRLEPGRRLDERPLARLPRRREPRIAMVAQGAMNSLNPVLRVRDQIYDALRDHGLNPSSQEFDRRVADLLERVGLRREVASMFPHELSGGMQQR